MHMMDELNKSAEYKSTRNKSRKDKSVRHNLETYFQNNVDRLKAYVMHLIYQTAIDHVYSSLRQDLRGRWTAYMSENAGRFNDYHLLLTPDDASISLRKYMREQLQRMTDIIHTDFEQYNMRVFGE